MTGGSAMAGLDARIPGADARPSAVGRIFSFQGAVGGLIRSRRHCRNRISPHRGRRCPPVGPGGGMEATIGCTDVEPARSSNHCFHDDRACRCFVSLKPESPRTRSASRRICLANTSTGSEEAASINSPVSNSTSSSSDNPLIATEIASICAAPIRPAAAAAWSWLSFDTVRARSASR